MNQPEGTVVAVGAGSVTVSVEAAAACARCSAGRGCGAGILQKGRTRVIEAKVARGLALERGDRVRLELAPEHLARAAWLAYGLPLVAMVAGTGAGVFIVPSDGDLAAVASGAIGLFAGVLCGRRMLAKDDCLRRIAPTA
ncbi:MAG TPA: SoxR reducing system RseC family protein, partial [Woeseiaceae bacterium]|nr:SoxR reducing system RseC family protein [Woeseiaceae bacterium]